MKGEWELVRWYDPITGEVHVRRVSVVGRVLTRLVWGVILVGIVWWLW